MTKTIDIDQHHFHPDDIQRFLVTIKSHMAELTGEAEVSGFQIAALIRLVANQYEHFLEHSTREDDLSGPRMGILVRLMEARRHGAGSLTPTELSRYQKVSRNTISALLRGLEDQKLIQRELNPDDRRLFHIRITESGIRAVRAIAPQRLALSNEMISGLNEAEQAQLIALLSKLYTSLQSRCQHASADAHQAAAGQSIPVPQNAADRGPLEN